MLQADFNTVTSWLERLLKYFCTFALVKKRQRKTRFSCSISLGRARLEFMGSATAAAVATHSLLLLKKKKKKMKSAASPAAARSQLKIYELYRTTHKAAAAMTMMTCGGREFTGPAWPGLRYKKSAAIFF